MALLSHFKPGLLLQVFENQTNLVSPAHFHLAPYNTSSAIRAGIYTLLNKLSSPCKDTANIVLFRKTNIIRPERFNLSDQFRKDY